MTGVDFTGIFERWKSDWIDPALGYMDGPKLKTDSHLNDASNEYSEFEIKAATRDFAESAMLGSGTFGSVYRGTMRDGTEVAIKVLQVPEEAGFEDEVKVLSRFRHPNLVILMGFARHAETGWRSLIYEFLAGGDVSRSLQLSRQQKEPFEWKARLSAGVDAACGLSHLHNMTPRAFHRDIKGPNILLDKNGTAKMADFGLSCVSSGSQHKVQQASGTVGYACPEYIRTGIITEGSEVHSFGMVLLELLTGAPPAVQRPDKPGEFCYLVDHLQGQKSKVSQMLDASGHFPTAVSQTMTDVAFRCITPNPSDRPLFKLLVEELRELLVVSSSKDAGTSNGGGSSAAEQAPAEEEEQSQAKGQGKGGKGQSGVRRVVLTVGSAVTSRWRGGSAWFNGRIVKVNQDGTFSIKYEDGDLEERVPGIYIRAAENQAPQGWRKPDSPVDEGYGPPPPPPPPPPGRATTAAAANAVSSDRPGQMPPPPPQPRPKALVPASADRRPSGQSWAPPAAGPEEAINPSAVPPYRLWCVYAEGVDFKNLPPQQRSIPSGSSPELTVGRTAQPAVVWDTLVPDRRMHGTVSREHFKVLPRRIPRTWSAVDQVSFVLVCTSINGVILNGKYIGNGVGEHPIQHGDVVALAVSLGADAANGPPGNASSSTRKPFVAFQFEVLGPSPAAAALPTGTPGGGLQGAVPVPPAPAEPQQQQPSPFEVLDGPRGEELQRPPAGSVAGRWRASDSAPAPSDALYCFEVHGDELRDGLPSEARQLFYCCESGRAATSAAPALRVGRFYQRGLWERILGDSFLRGGKRWAAMVAQDHFEVLPIRKSNPQLSAEPPDWGFKIRVLSSVGLTVNYSIVCTAGDERYLHPSDTLTIGEPSSRDSRRDLGNRQTPPGFHLTFIPLTGSLSQGLLEPDVPREAESLPKLSPEPARPLPELPDEEATGLTAPRAWEGTGMSLPSTSRAAALRPPTSVLPPTSGVEDALEDEDASPLPSALPVATRINLRPDDNENLDDLFSKTGFRSDQKEENESDVPDEGDDVPVYLGNPSSRGTRASGGWLSKFSC